MKAIRGAQRHGRRTGYLAAATMLLTWTPAGAATNFDPDCPSLEPDADAATLPAPALRIEMTDLVTPPPAPLARHALAPREAPAITSRQTVDELLEEAEPTAEDAEPQDFEGPALPPTATRLPGVDDEDLPRFRRQMFRTDI